MALRMRIQERAGPDAKFRIERVTESIHFAIHEGKIIYRDVPDYEGDTWVRPGMDEIVLATKGLKMPEDVTVEAIPVSVTANPAGGLTYCIGD